jgi:tetratricopeptide (TPR) repeat protein
VPASAPLSVGPWWRASNVARLAAAIIVVGAAVTATHWPALSSRAVCFDDGEYVLDNPLVRNPSWDSARRFLTEVWEPSTVGGYYQPLAMISLMLDSAQTPALGAPDLSFRVFHRTSLALHVANTALLTVLTYVLFGDVLVAAMVGLVFGVHPITVEPIPWLGERKTLLSAFFAFACLTIYVCYTRRHRWWLYAAALGSFILALMSKPISMPLAVCLLLMDWWPLHRLSRNAVLEKIPFFAVTAVSAVVTFFSQNTTFGVEMPAAKPPEWIPLLLCHDLIFYVRTLLWPVDLTPHYPIPQPMSVLNASVALSVVAALALVGVLVFARRWTVAPLASWAFFFVAVLPTTGIIGFSIVATSDKFAYLPAAGLLMGLAALLLWLREQLRSRWGRPMATAVTCLAVAVIVALEAWGTRSYYTQWRDTETLDKHMLSLAPNSSDIHSAYATEMIRQGRYGEAVDHLNTALAIDPTDAQVHNNLGVVLAQQGKLDEAIVHFSLAVQARPNFAVWRRNLDTALADKARRARSQP